MKGLKWKLLMKTLSLVLTGVLTNTDIHSNEASVQNFVFVKSSLFCVNCASAFWKRAISPKIGCNSQMNFLHAPLLHKKNCPDWTQLNDPIHIPDIVFHFLERRSPKFPCSQVQQVLLIGPFLFFLFFFFSFSCHDLLLGYQLEQNDTGKGSFEDNRDPTKVTLLYISTFTTWQMLLFLFFKFLIKKRENYFNLNKEEKWSTLI